MRVGDVYKIEASLKNGASDKQILERFKNDYSEDEIKKFIEVGKAALKPAPKSKAKPAPKKKPDPLG